MKQDEFTKVLQHRINDIQTKLYSKGKEYGAVDRLHNFKRAAELGRCTLDKALFGMLNKHIISIADMVLSDDTPPQSLVDEKIGDLMSYAVLLDAVWREMRQ